MAEYKAIAPNEKVFGSYSPNYGAYLAAPTGNLGLDIGNGMELKHLAAGEQGAYLAALDKANHAQLQGQALNDQSDVATHSIDQFAPATLAGVGGYLLPNFSNADPMRSTQADTVHADATAQQGYLNRATGVKALSDAGFAPSAADVSGGMAGPLDRTVTPYLQYANPGDVARGRTADADINKAASYDYLVHHPPAHSGLGAGGEVVSVQDNGFGVPPTIIVKGGKGQDPAAVAAAAEAARNATNGAAQGQSGPRHKGQWKRVNGKLVRE